VNRPPGLRPLFRLPWTSRRQVASDVDEELRFHLEQVTEALRAQGWPELEARREAERRFGDVEYTRTYCRNQDLSREKEHRRVNYIEELGQDLRYAFRSLRSARGFTAVALLTLALGIGANTAIFSVVRWVLLEPLPFTDPDRLVRVWHAQPSSGIEQGSFSEPDFLDMKRESRQAASMGGFFFADGLLGVDLTGAGNPERLTAAIVSDGFFQTLGTRALLGRTLRPDEHVPGQNRVAVFSHGFWTRRFGADPSVVGRTVTLNGDPMQVVGVMPPAFTYPANQTLDIWLPMSYFDSTSIGRSRAAHFISVVARAGPAVSEAQLRTELAGIAARLSREHPENPGWDNVTTAGLRESIVGEVREPIIVLMVAVGMLLLLACVNIASLLLARASGRQRELAVRAALGAGRGRIARQLLTESLTLGVLGGVLGIALGYFAVQALAATSASELPRADRIRVDGVVLAFTMVVAVLSGLLFGMFPTLRASSANLEGALRAGARGSVGGAGQRLRSGLVVVEVALAVILVVGAGLATKSFSRLLSVNPGFQPSNALVVTMSVPDRYESRAARATYYYQILDAIRRLPGVTAAGSVRDVPTRGNGEMVRPGIQGRPIPAGQEGPAVQLHHISTDFFKAMGTPLRAGRSFEMTDDSAAAPVTVVNEELARRFWPGEEAVGKALMFGQFEMRVIGVVGDVRQRGLAEPVEPTMYRHVLQNSRSRMSIVIRTQGDPLGHANAVRRAIWAQDANQTIASVTTLEDLLGAAVTRPRLLAWLLALFGVIGLTLGSLGIFGVLAYLVNQRRQEMGVRLALGASPRSLLTLVVGRGMLLAGGGIALGVLGAALLTRFMQNALYGISPSDPATFALVILVLLGAALLASWLPARRALRIDPVTALRYD
jgi:predicted permease